jgi:hypothetical protein
MPKASPQNAITLSKDREVVPRREMIYPIIEQAGAPWLTRVTQTASFTSRLSIPIQRSSMPNPNPIKPVARSRVSWSDGCSEFGIQGRQCPGVHALDGRAGWQ